MSSDEKASREPVKCARPNCHEVFVPKSKDHKFCSNTCKKRVFRYRGVLNLPAREN